MKLNVLKQYLVPQHALSGFAGWLANCRWQWVKNAEIRYFINRYQVNIDEALFTKIDDYPTFNSFFTRLLKPELRPIVTAPGAIASPADGQISQIGKIKIDRLLQAKGFDFNLLELLGGNENHVRLFQDGNFATIYLAPKDYHRVHIPITGTLRETIYIPGKLFSVNQLTTENVPKLFSRNERLVCLFETACGPMAVILVGAMLVGSINTVWASSVYSRKILTQTYTDQAITLTRGSELGHFKMGSTVIILFPNDKINWSSDLKENSLIKMGEFMGSQSSP